MPNFDEKTGIRYGVISPHSISSFALDDIYNEGTDPQYESAKEDFENGLKSAIKEFCDNNSNMRLDDRHIDIDAIMDQWNDHYESDGSGIMDYSDNEYSLHVSGDNFGIFVMKSPYYTFCRGCSPCAPGAGDLNNPIDPVNLNLSTLEHISAKTLCLGPEWFDREKDQYSRNMPYRCFKVSDDTEVFPEVK
ncbi:MAG: hypothetical protein M0R00_08390 [Candidatus Omnitrophica bacterium]|jgi:hypothetical protein|nr:hypothetical protein [Candidatus Omnitrophota bacterium]